MSASAGRPEAPGLGGAQSRSAEALEQKNGVKERLGGGGESGDPQPRWKRCRELRGRNGRLRCPRRSLSQGEAMGRQKSDKKIPNLDGLLQGTRNVKTKQKDCITCVVFKDTGHIL